MSRRWLALALSASVAGAASGQRLHVAGDYTVHYNAFPSGFLAPELAREHGILRSRTRGVLLVSTKRDGQAVFPRVDAQVGPGGGRLQPLPLRPVRIGGAVSYIGSFAIVDGESRQFRLDIAPPDGQPFTVTFSQQFFNDR